MKLRKHLSLFAIPLIMGGLSENALAYTSKIDWNFEIVDTFDGTVATQANDYGLTSTGNELRGLYGNWGTQASYTRVAGTWYDKPGPLSPWTVQAGNNDVTSAYKNSKLSFALEPSAVRLQKSLIPAVPKTYYISATVNPIAFDTAQGEWVSIMLDPSNTKRGYVTETAFGFYIRSNGQIAVLQNGTVKSTYPATFAAADEYKVELDIRNGQLEGKVNGVPFSADLDASAVPATAYLYLGAYITQNSNKFSTIDDLVVRTGKSATKNITSYGYTWATAYNYPSGLDLIGSYTNANEVKGPETQFASPWCNQQKCILDAGRYLLDNNGNLRPDWPNGVITMVNTIKTYRDKIKAVYLLDEPLPTIATTYGLIVDEVKKQFTLQGVTPVPLFTVLAIAQADAVAQNSAYKQALAKLDLIGFDYYANKGTFASMVGTRLQTMKTNFPTQKLVLVPQTHYYDGSRVYPYSGSANANSTSLTCGGCVADERSKGIFPLTSSDVETAEINWMYYKLAVDNRDRVGAIWNFGLWTHATPEQMLLTRQVQRLIGQAILN